MDVKPMTNSSFLICPDNSFQLHFPPFTLFSILPSLTCSAPPVLPALRPDHSSVLHKALVCRWKGVYSRIRQLLYMPQWLRNALLPHSRTGSNTSNSRLQSRAKRDGTLRSGQQWEGLTVSLMWKCSRACGYSHTACSRDWQKKDMLKKKWILKSYTFCLTF